MLVDHRFCPRCNVRTDWDNGDTDGGLALACTMCGLTADEPLTEEEHERLLAYDAVPVVPRRRRYVLT